MSQHSLRFRDLGVSERIADALSARSIEEPFEIQRLVLPDALAGLDILAKSPTGSGKTLAFAIPIVERTSQRDKRPAALVLVPTRELAQQVADELVAIGRGSGLEVAAVYGGTPLRKGAEHARKAHVVVATPGRLEDLAQRRLLDLSAIRILVLDEADRMLDMGFKPQVDRIVRRLPRNRQTMFFSATLDGEVGELARAYTSSPSRFEGRLPHERRTGEIEHQFVAVRPETKLETLVEHLRANDGLTLVFVRTKRGADLLARKLARHQVDAVAMHGNMTQGARQRALLSAFPGAVRADVLEGTWSPPVSDGSGRDRAMLRRALDLLAAAGFELRGTELLERGSRRPLGFEILVTHRDEERLARERVEVPDHVPGPSGVDVSMLERDDRDGLLGRQALGATEQKFVEHHVAVHEHPARSEPPESVPERGAWTRFGHNRMKVFFGRQTIKRRPDPARCSSPPRRIESLPCSTSRPPPATGSAPLSKGPIPRALTCGSTRLRARKGSSTASPPPTRIPTWRWRPPSAPACEASRTRSIPASRSRATPTRSSIPRRRSFRAP